MTIFSPDDDILEEEEQVGQLSGQTEHVGKNFGPGERIGQLSEQIGQLSDQIGQLSGQVGQSSGQPEHVGEFSEQVGQFPGQAGQAGQVGHSPGQPEEVTHVTGLLSSSSLPEVTYLTEIPKEVTYVTGQPEQVTYVTGQFSKQGGQEQVRLQEGHPGHVGV